MKDIIQGIQSFQSETHPKKGELLAKLASGQSPKVLLITCSDSRIVPSLITHTDPGDIFIIRNAGNLVAPFSSSTAASGEEATIEYAVAALGVEHIVVCGHSDCGAMKGVMNPDALSGVPSVAKWLEGAFPTKGLAESKYGADLSDADKLSRVIELNALRQVENLRGHKAVAAAVADGKVALHAWVYSIGTGVITAYDEGQDSFVALESDATPIQKE
ncbi:MAG: carbonic anhydrase, partial [Planctomycetota bacterium]